MAKAVVQKAEVPPVVTEEPKDATSEALQGTPRATRANYRLCTPFWDNTRLHKKGDVVEFEVGKAPKGSTLIKDEPEQAEDDSKDSPSE